jgi:hypothetical protein
MYSSTNLSIFQLMNSAPIALLMICAESDVVELLLRLA